MVFGDEEIQPRRKGSGMKDMYGVNSDQKRRMRQEERKRQYASELQAQIAERERKKREDKARDRAAEHNAQAFGDAIGRLDAASVTVNQKKKMRALLGW